MLGLYFSSSNEPAEFLNQEMTRRVWILPGQITFREQFLLLVPLSGHCTDVTLHQIIPSFKKKKTPTNVYCLLWAIYNIKREQTEARHSTPQMNFPRVGLKANPQRVVTQTAGEKGPGAFGVCVPSISPCFLAELLRLSLGHFIPFPLNLKRSAISLSSLLAVFPWSPQKQQHSAF